MTAQSQARTVQSQARASAAQAARSKPLHRLARAGFLGYGLMHVLLAWLALQIAFGQTSAEGDQYGAFGLLARNAAGRAVLAAVMVGLVAMAVWQMFAAAIGHRDREGARRVVERVVSAGRTVVYGYFAWIAGKVVFGGAKSSAGKQEQATAGALGSGGGRALVVAIGVGVAAIGIGLALYGLTRKFEEHLHVEQMSRTVRQLMRWLGVTGYTTKGLAYAIVGGLLVTAAVTYDPKHARGLDAALRTLAEQPYGWLLLGLVAIGFLAYGLYCAGQARFRET
jgi:Domain of Unknown Function (DUF1206)